LFHYEAQSVRIDIPEQIEVLTFHKIKLFEEIQWWKDNLSLIDWLNESPNKVIAYLKFRNKFFLDSSFPPDDASLGFDTSSNSLMYKFFNEKNWFHGALEESCTYPRE
jgi:hypothetical protein